MSGLCGRSAWFGACVTAAVVSLPLGIFGLDIVWLLLGLLNAWAAWSLKKSLENE